MASTLRRGGGAGGTGARAEVQIHRATEEFDGIWGELDDSSPRTRREDNGARKRGNKSGREKTGKVERGDGTFKKRTEVNR